MFARAASGTVIGVEGHNVTVEAHRANGLPGMAVIGLARGAMKESATRVRSAIVATGLKLGSHRLVINLLPAELPKEASSLDLALAVSLLASGELLPVASLLGRRFIGELSLGGALEPVRGAILLAELARRCADKELLVPLANAAESAIIPGVRVIGVRHLGEVVAHLLGRQVIAPSAPPPLQPRANVGCFSEVFGQGRAKRAMEIAAAGGHNLLMIGPPGSGKTMLARRMVGLLPALCTEQAIEVTRIHAAAEHPQQASGDRAVGLVQHPPFRAPHHTASEVALCGGGGMPRPGEITLAHRGVLFLDELPEFSRRALESLRQPLEEGSIHIARASMSLRFPAEVLLLAAMNPCPCGYAPVTATPLQPAQLFEPHAAASPPNAAAAASPQGPAAAPLPQGVAAAAPRRRVCLCAFERIARYRARISGPLLDRIDLHVAVAPVAYREFCRHGTGERSEVIRGRVARARRSQEERFGGARLNARMTAAQLQACVPLSEASMKDLETATETYFLSTRAIARILKVARTIADLAAAEVVLPEHVREAIGFRLLDGEQAGPTAPLHPPCSDATAV
jgi:magnesium chelatase family protein